MTALPEPPPVAATVYVPLYAGLLGVEVNVIAWLDWTTETDALAAEVAVQECQTAPTG